MHSSTFDHSGEDAFRARIAPAGPGPIDAAVCGALERLAIDNAQCARSADKDDRTFFRRATTSYVNALIQYRAGVRPERLSSRAYLLPSRQSGEPPHLVTLDGDWICSCRAARAMHWQIALIVGIEVAHDDMTRFDDPPNEPSPLGDEEGDACPDEWRAASLCAAERDERDRSGTLTRDQSETALWARLSTARAAYAVAS